MAKKKKPIDDKQKSLFAYVDEKKEEKTKKVVKSKKKPAEDEAKKDIEKPSPEKTAEEKKGKQPEEEFIQEVDEKDAGVKDEMEHIPAEIPPEMFFKGNEEPFGLKKDAVELKDVKRESVSSKYIRYLIKNEKIVENMDRGLLLDVDYDGGENKAYCKFYDLDDDEIKIWIDTTGHEPYCLSKESKSDLENISDLVNYEGFKRFEEVEIKELLSDQDLTMTKIYGNTPLDIGGSGKNIKNILGDSGLKAWEADIRYHLNYIFDTQLISGLIYSIKNGKIEKISYEEETAETKTIANELRAVFENEAPQLQEFSEKFLDIFLTPIPDVKRMAMDIEVDLGPEDFVIPDPRQAKQKVISISFVATDGLKLVYALERDGFLYRKPHEDFPKDAKVVYFKKEKDLLVESFRLMWEYPVVITFNGDNFDLNYLFHRANKLKVHRDLNPIHVKRGFGVLSRSDCDLRKGIHIDIFNFFFNRSISGYAFGGAYESSSLNAISAALLGEMKYEHEEEIQNMEYDILTWYNLKDSLLTLDLTKFNNSLVWNLIILLCRITKLPIHEMTRRQISTWIQNIFYFEHRRNNYLIPRRSEISERKPGGKMMSKTDDEKFQGAYVIPPVPGIHYEVVVMDFASLYPSIIKEYNLSYETVLCPHKSDMDNMLKGTPYYTCTSKMGIFAYVVGFFRDIRVKYFKPKSSDKSLTPKQRSYNHTIQQALKVFINGSYGVFGSQNFPLFCLPVAESTTAIGQYSIKQTIKKSEDLGVTVLYGDTDSVFLLNPTKKQMNEISKWSKDELDLDLEEEKTYQFLALSGRKKNYVGIYKDTRYVDIKGLVAKKKNTPDFIKKVFNELVEILKTITNDEEFSKAREEIVEIVQSNMKKIGKSRAFTLEDYAISISIQKEIKQYTKVIPQHVRAAIELQQATGKEFHRGDTIQFIKSKGPTGAKALELAKLQDIDPKKYRDLLQSALEQVLDALGISFEEIKGIKKMDSFF